MESFESASSGISTDQDEDDISNCDSFDGIMAEFKDDYKDPIKQDFFQRIPDYLRLFLTQRNRNKEYIALQQLEEKHRRAIFK